jgi:cyclomaltodextrinase / maltogenic alpha-amylase / neopullulanase
MLTVRRKTASAVTSLVWLALVALGAASAYGNDDAIPIAGQAQTIPQTFRFDTRSIKPRPTTVNLAGSFNHFSHVETPMEDDGGGVFTATLQLAPDIYHYKFLADGTSWFTDPAADKSLEDKSDHDNSGVLVGVDGRQLPVPLPNHIEPRGLAHDPTSDSDCNIASSSLLRLRVRVQADDVQRVTAHFRTDPQSPWQQQELFPAGRKFGFEYFGGVVTTSTTDSTAAASLQYLFELIDGTSTKYLASGVLYSTAEPARQHPYLRTMEPTFETPDWSRHAVWYQIFPERFRNGDPSNDPKDTQRWTSLWYANLPGEEGGDENFYKGESNVFKRRYGGDIQGIRQELPYLKSLGVNALYLNPIFQADSLHKYDTRDYRHVDDHFGIANSADELTGETEDPATWKWSASDKLFLDFVADAHRQGFKIILDGVFNHVGKSHPFFQDVVKNGKSSRYADWFVIYDWGNGGAPGKPGGLQYQAWEARNGSLPIWKKDPKLGIVHGPREHIMAITRRWLAPDGDVTRGVDGFRLDAANEIPHPFWVDWRKLVKSINPDAYIDGEIWSWAQPWLKGDQFDAVMNYQFAMASQSFFVDRKLALTPTQFSNRLQELFYNYPLQVVLAQQNLFDSHDTDRFASRFLNPDIGYNQHDRLQEAGSKYNAGPPTSTDWIRDQQAVVFQMCFAGSPMVYYGDEAGMWSPSDPSDRMPMWWKDLEPFDDPHYRFNQKEFDWYQRCIAIHRQLPALQTGSFHPILIDDQRGIFGFARDITGQTVRIVLNRSSTTASVEVPVNAASRDDKILDWLNPEQVALAPDGADGRPALRVNAESTGYPVSEGIIHLTLPPFGVVVLAPVK